MTAVNKSKDFLKGKVEYQIEDEVLTNEVETNEVMLPEEYITNNSKREIILQLMSDTLTHSQYVTVFLFYFDELSISEISEVLEVSEGTVKSRLNSSRKKMKTAIEKYEEENNDRLHGVVFVPLFGSIFKEEAKNLTVPKIDLVLPKQSSNSIASIGTESAVKTASKGLVSSVLKAKVIAVVCGMVILTGSSLSTGVLAGCGREDLPIATNASSTEVTTEPTEIVSEDVAEATKATVSEEVKEAVKVDEVKEVTQPTKGSSSEPKETVKPTQKPTQKATQPTTKKPSVQPTTKKPVTPPPTQKPTEREKVWHEPVYKTVHHPAETKVVHHDAVTHEEPIYETVGYYVCNQCGAELSDTNQLEQHFLANENCGSYRYKKGKVQIGTTTVVDKEAYDETVVVKEAWDEKVLVKEGYWEYK